MKMQNHTEIPESIILSEKQQQLLDQIVKASTSSKSVSKRASILLALFEGYSKYHIVNVMGVSWPTLNKWEARWLNAQTKLNEIENNEPLHILKKAIVTLLKDAPRPGAPCTFTEEQVTQIIALACTSPEAEGLPVSHWSCRLLAKHAQKLGIVEYISYRQVNVFLKSRGFKTA
jgi:putative transposase